MLLVIYVRLNRSLILMVDNRARINIPCDVAFESFVLCAVSSIVLNVTKAIVLDRSACFKYQRAMI